MISPPSPIIHDVIRNSKLFLTFSSTILAVLCVFIIRKSPAISKEYAKLLFVLIFVATQFDVYSQIVFDPQYIMPAFCIYRDSPILNIPLNAAWGYIIWITLVALNCPVYAACFIHRHQIIVPDNSMFKLNSSARNTCLIVISVPCLSYGYSYYLAWRSPDAAIMKYFSSEWDPVVISRMECIWDYKELRNAWGGLLFICSFIFVTAISLHTFMLIRRAKNLSAKRKSFQRIMLVSLIVVAAVPMSFIVVPFGLAIVYFTFHDTNDPSLPIMEFANLFIACHSIVHSLTLILSTPAFRRKLYEVMCMKSIDSAAVSSSKSQFMT